MQWANECISLSWNCKENSSLLGLLSHIVITFIMIAGWISNPHHLLSCYLHSSILSPLWTLLGHSRAWAASSTQLFFLGVWCCGASQHLWIKTSRFWFSSMSSEVRHVWTIHYTLTNKTLNSSSLPSSIFRELQPFSDRKHSGVCVCGDAGARDTKLLAACCCGYCSPLFMTAQFTETGRPWKWILFCCPQSVSQVN